VDEVSLSDVIAEISEQLLVSQDQRIREGRPALFLVGSVDIEMSFVVTHTTAGSAGIDLRVVKADGKKQYEDQQVQRVTVHLVGAQTSAGEEGKGRFQDISASELTPVRPRPRFRPD